MTWIIRIISIILFFIAVIVSIDLLREEDKTGIFIGIMGLVICLIGISDFWS